MLLQYHQAVANQIASRKEELFSMIENDVRTKILEMSTAETLSFLIYNGTVQKSIPAKANMQYAKVLLCFLKDKNYSDNGCTYIVESKVTRPLLEQIENTIIRFYSSAEVQDEISRTIENSISNARIVKSSIKGIIDNTKKDVKNEVGRQMLNYSTKDVRDNIMSNVTSSITTFMHSEFISQLSHSIGALLASGTGKVVTSKIALTLSKTISASALKPIIASIVKKIGVKAMIKSSVGKGVTLLLPAIGFPVEALIYATLVTAIGAILLYEYHTFPKKLADKVPMQVVKELQTNFDQLNNNIVWEILNNMDKNIENEIPKKKTNKWLSFGGIVAIILIVLLIIWTLL